MLYIIKELKNNHIDVIMIRSLMQQKESMGGMENSTTDN